MKLPFLRWPVGFAAMLLLGFGSALAETSKLTVETKEITRPDVAASPTGEWLVITSLGHLFQVQRSGGEAKQLTFGPWFDSEPAISPDGRQIVFSSDRGGGTNGSLYILSIESGKLHRLTSGEWASRPVWSPDGQHIAYLSYQPQGLWAEYEFIAHNGVLATVKKISVDGGDPTTLTEAPGLIRSAFFMPDGRIGWTVQGVTKTKQRTNDSGSIKNPGSPVSEIRIVGASAVPSAILSIPGVIDRIVPDGDGFLVRHYGIPAAGFLVPQNEAIASISPKGEIRSISTLMNPQPRPKFAVVDGQIYLGERGKLFRINAETGERTPIPLKTTIEMEVLGRADPISYNPEDRSQTLKTTVLDPRLTPDGKEMFFTAAGFIWRQTLESGNAKRINSDLGFQWGAAAISPDGKQIAYQQSEDNLQHLKVHNLGDGSEKTLVTADRTGRFEPSWSPDGTKIVYVSFSGALPRLYIIDVVTGNKRKLVNTFPRWMPRPQFSSDGHSVYYTDRNQVRQISIGDGSKPRKVTDFSNVHIGDGTVSPDGRWLAYRKNDEIWVVRLDDARISEESAKKLTNDGGWNFSFSPDSKSLVYSIGHTVWSHPIVEGEATTLPVRLVHPDNTPVSVLIRNVRVLDFEADKFTDTVSMLVENRRIQWIGSEVDKSISDEVRILDADGRYAIPGLFDSHTHVATPIHFNPARDVSRMSSNLAFGITSVRDMGSDITLVKSWEDRRRFYSAPVPRIFSGGAMVEAAGPFFHGGSQFAANDAEARNIVRKEVRDGVVGIKSYFTLPWSQQRAIANEAFKLGVPVYAHGLTFRETVMGPVLGRTSVEHQPLPIRLYDDVLQLMAKSGTKWTPTITATGGNGVLMAQQPHLLSDAKVRAFTSQSDFALAKEVELFSILDPKVLGQTYADLLVSIKQGYETGVQILVGTDALNPNVFYGHGQQTEMLHLARAGIPAIDILRFATIESARTVGVEKHLGTLEPGKLADMVFLNSNPMKNITNTLDIWKVMQDGNLFTQMAEPSK
ncbi:MAG: amidohydrolase family protein [Rhizobiaceae bacterium]